MIERLFATAEPSVLLVVETSAAVPYVHLHLESRRRFYPQVPMIVHDDGSDQAARMQELCVAYGANFFSPQERLGPGRAQLSALLLAVQSAQQLGLDLAVKMSHDFVPITDWVPQLQDVAARMQYATFSHRDEAHGFGFRSECAAFHAATWADDECAGRIERVLEADGDDFGLVEAFVHGLARDVYARTQCAANERYERLYPPDPDADAYGIWPWLGHSRTVRRPSFLWHDADTPLDYFRLAQAYGLPYRWEETDPNVDQAQGLPE